MLLNETSRLAQLTDAGLAKFVESLGDTGVTFFAIKKEISSVVGKLSLAKLTESADWYFAANTFASELADEFNTTIEIASGVISAISPRMRWSHNKTNARNVFVKLDSVSDLSPHDAAEVFAMGFYSNFAMAIKIARGEDISTTLSGTKRRSFYNNIVNPTVGDSVTIDTWMARAIMNTNGMSLKTASEFLRKNRVALGGTGVGYYLIAESVREVAKRLNMLPHEVQAAYWVSVSS
jgi:hypothetical protein